MISYLVMICILYECDNSTTSLASPYNNACVAVSFKNDREYIFEMLYLVETCEML